MAAARVIPGVCGVLQSNSPARTTRIPCCFQSLILPQGGGSSKVQKWRGILQLVPETAADTATENRQTALYQDWDALPQSAPKLPRPPLPAPWDGLYRACRFRDSDQQ